MGTAEVVFLLTIAATFAMAALGRRHSGMQADEGLAGRSLNRWLVGLSAGTTANSGFIVTAAVGLGYTYGLHWLMLPFSWLLGDLVFWRFFPDKINKLGRSTNATTLSELLSSDLTGRVAQSASYIAAIIIVICLTGYTSAQWLAGQKFLTGAFELPNYLAVSLFAIMIVAYSAIGGFRGSVYTDALQAVIRVVGTIVALAAIGLAAASDSGFVDRIALAGPDFLNPFPQGLLYGFGFVFGFASAAVGFGLGQPQLLSRYLAGSSPKETLAAKWIYIGFVQSTWIAMTAFGVILRGVMPDISDPEEGLSIFFRSNVNAVATGIIVADVFATIASTSNALVISIAQAISHDLLRTYSRKIPFALVTFIVGISTMVVSSLIQGSVVSLALSSVSLMGAGLAPAVMVKIMGWRHTAWSLLLAIGSGLTCAILWKSAGLSAAINEAAPGIAGGLIVNWLICRFNNAPVRRHSAIE